MTAPAPAARKARALKPADNATAPATAKPPAKAGPKAGRKAKAGKNATRGNVAARGQGSKAPSAEARDSKAAPKKERVEHRAADGRRRPPKPERLSALNAAVLVLASAPDEGLSAKDMVTQMVAQGLWYSPAGKTPEATLYAGICREIGRKGERARFRKVSRGRFVLAEPAA
tara:strand:- start:6501 stop:7016 length:516 start_codon:yes stop_codon:yes gene_type:complete